MAIDPLSYVSQLWTNIHDGNAQEAVRDLAQKLGALASDVAGVIGSPAITPMFRAYRASALTLAGTGNQQINMDAVQFDTAGEFNTTTGLWTPSVSGVYQVSIGVAFATNQAAGSQLELKLYKGPLAGGARDRYFFYQVLGTANQPQMNGSDLVQVTAGNTYSVVATTTTASTQFFNDPSATWFSAALQA